MTNWLDHQNEIHGKRRLFFRIEAQLLLGEKAVVVPLPVSGALFDEVGKIASRFELSLHCTDDADDMSDSGMGHEWHKEWDETRAPVPAEAALELLDSDIRVSIDTDDLRADPIIEVNGKPISIDDMEPIDCGQAKVLGFVFGVSRYYKRFQLLFPLDDESAWEGSTIDEGSNSRYWGGCDITMRRVDGQ